MNNKILETVAKLKRVVPTSDLEKAIIKNLINSHLITIYDREKEESLNVILGYEPEMYHNCLEELNKKIGKM